MIKLRLQNVEETSMWHSWRWQQKRKRKERWIYIKEAEQKKGHFYTWQKRRQKKKEPTHTVDKHKRSRAWHAIETYDTLILMDGGIHVYALTFNENFRRIHIKRYDSSLSVWQYQWLGMIELNITPRFIYVCFSVYTHIVHKYIVL